MRKNTLVFYDYVRGLDEIADDPSRGSSSREAALMGVKIDPPLWAQPYVAACDRGRINPHSGEQLLQAFVQDCRKDRYANWQELMGYCQLSAVPVGRFILTQANEGQADLQAADALCALLQIVNHLQDARKDYERLGRVYLPQDMMQQYGVDEAMLEADAMSEELRALYDAMLDHCNRLLEQSRSLPASISSRRLRWQLQWIIHIAARLMKKLRQQDAIAQKITLSRWEYAGALWR